MFLFIATIASLIVVNNHLLFKKIINYRIAGSFLHSCRDVVISINSHFAYDRSMFIYNIQIESCF